MAYRVKVDGCEVTCDTADEVRALLGARSPAPPVGAEYGTEKWREVHKNDKRLIAHVERLRALAPHFDKLTPLQRQVVDLRVQGKRPAEIAKEMGRAPTTIMAIGWDALKRLQRAAAAAAEPRGPSPHPDLKGALRQLGYKDADYRAVARRVEAESLDDQVKEALRLLAKPAHVSPSSVVSPVSAPPAEDVLCSACSADATGREPDAFGDRYCGECAGDDASAAGAGE